MRSGNPGIRDAGRHGGGGDQILANGNANTRENQNALCAPRVPFAFHFMLGLGCIA